MTARAGRVDRAVARNTDQPGREITSWLKAAGRLPDSLEYILRHLFGRFAIADDPQRDCVDQAAVAIVDRGERRLLVPAHPRDQLLVRWRAGGPAAGGRWRRDGFDRHYSPVSGTLNHH